MEKNIKENRSLKKYKFISILLFMMLLPLVGCEQIELERALRYAGSNREELNSVLEHYKNDPRKLAAAKYLIINMPGHYSYEQTPGMDTLRSVLSDIYHHKNVPMERIQRCRYFNYESVKKIYDSHVITADFLISNIDDAFEVYDLRRWNRYVSFDDFCEYLLPYRVGHEPLENWRRLFREKYDYILDSLYRGSDVVAATNVIYEEMKGNFFKNNAPFPFHDLGASFLMDNRIGTCQEICDFSLYLMRSIGIPAMTDLFNQRRVHSWNRVLDTTGRSEMFVFDDLGGKRAIRGYRDTRQKGKVYRECFANMSKDRAHFNNYKDVTAEYFGENNARIKLDTSGLKGMVWLSLYNNPVWHPIVCKKPYFSRVNFKNIEPEMVFVVTEKTGSENKEVSYPFIMQKNGKVRYFVPDTGTLVPVQLNRKIRLMNRIKGYMSESEGGVVEGSLTPDFIDTDTLAVLKCPTTNYNYCQISSRKEYRFLRFRPAEGKQIQMGEMRFFSDVSRQDTLSVRVFDCSASFDSNVTNVVDGDELTFYQSVVSEPFLVLDLGRRCKIALLEWVPRNDDNFIRYGDEYELYFHLGAKGWQSLGSQVAKDTVLYYNEVPQNSLLILRNHTRGREEEVFIMENGKQRFL